MSEGRGVKVDLGDRLGWYAEAADEEHWHQRWRQKVTPDYYTEARSQLLGADRIGRLVLDSFPSGGRVIEAGCGAGRYVAALQEAGYDVDGVEFSQALVELINAVEPGLPVRCADVTKLDVPDGTYSSYLSLGVIEHRAEGPGPFLEEARRVVEPGGRAIFAVPAFGPLRRLKARVGRYATTPPDLPFYQYGFTADGLSALVREAGFTVDEVHYDGVHRMLDEEVPAYRWLVLRRGGERLVKRPLGRLLANRDGHMVVVVATNARP